MPRFDINKLKIGVVGLGYVGLPLAVEFGRKYPTVGFDINAARVAELEGGSDSTLECSDEELAAATHLSYTTDLAGIAGTTGETGTGFLAPPSANTTKDLTSLGIDNQLPVGAGATVEEGDPTNLLNVK